MCMDYEKWILEKLINKYEKSKAFTSGEFNKRIMLDVTREKDLHRQLEKIDEKNRFLDVLYTMEKAGMLQYSWIKYEEGNLVEKIWLVTEAGSIETCYKILKRISPKEQAKKLTNLIQKYGQELEKETEVYRFMDEMQKELEEKQKLPRFFTEDFKLNEDVLKCLCFMEKNQDEQMERVLSMKLYGDSKYFEKTIKSKVLSILRWIKKQDKEENREDEELLCEKGISRWPEVMEFTGNLKVVLEDDTRIDYSTQKYGAYINSDTVKCVKKVILKCVEKIVFVENKANYIWYLSHRKTENELVLFHGGCYSPVKGLWFKKIYLSSKKQEHNIKYFHWSDIDVGGFRIFVRLRKNIVPELEPYQMDCKTLEDFRKNAIKIEESSYRKILEEMEKDSEYAIFNPVISRMLELDIRLEQESVLV